MKRTANLTAIFIISILLILGIFLFTQNQNLKEEIINLNNRIIELEKQQSAAEKPPEGWKEYVDDEYKFKIWYPEEFNYINNVYKTEAQNTKYADYDNVSFFLPFNSEALPLLDIYIYKDKNIEQVVAKDAQELRISIDKYNEYKELVKINSQNFYKFNIPGNIRYYTDKNGILFAFFADKRELTEKTSMQMIQDFQFIK